MRKALLHTGFVALSLALAAGLPACKREEAAASQPPKEAAPLLHVQTATVAERPMPEFLVLTGSLRADQESNVAADANGKVRTSASRRAISSSRRWRPTPTAACARACSRSRGSS
jgi:multidrug efflux pump subunit AcrA (membrane-fusion protein)